MSLLTFANPWWLAAVLPIALLVVAVIHARRKRMQKAIPFTGTTLLAEFSTGSAKKRLPAVLAATGSMLVILGLAGPTLPVLLDQQRANVVLLIDISGSMTATDVQPSRLAAAQSAAAQFISALPEQWKAGLVAFAEQPVLVTAPTDDRQAVIAGLASLTATGGTGTGDALNMAVDVGRAGNAERVTRSLADGDNLPDPSRTVVVMLSDGRPTAGVETAQAAAYRAQRLGVPVFGIAFGTDTGVITVLDGSGQEKRLEVPPDPGTMQQIASITGGGYFTAVTADELAQVYQSVNAKLESEAGTLEPGNFLVLLGMVLLGSAAAVAAHRGVLP